MEIRSDRHEKRWESGGSLRWLLTLAHRAILLAGVVLPPFLYVQQLWGWDGVLKLVAGIVALGISRYFYEALKDSM
jgi:hypothetical protein